MVNIAAILFIILCALISATRCSWRIPAIAAWLFLLAAGVNVIALALS